jgi:hypothetical protein
MAMSKKPPQLFALDPEIDLPEEPLPIYPTLERTLASRWQGTYSIRVYETTGSGNTPIGTIEIPSVKDHESEPECSQETIASYAMAYAFQNTEKRERKCRYRIRIHQRVADKKYMQWNVDFGQSPTGEPTVDLPSAASVSAEIDNESKQAVNSFLDGATRAVSMALDKASAIVGQAMEMNRHTSERIDRSLDRYEGLVHGLVQDRDNHSKIAQTGFDALHHGVEMQGASLQQKWEYEVQIRDLRAELENSRNNSKGGMTQGLIQMMAPLFTIAGAQFLTKMGALPPGSDKEITNAVATQFSPGGGLSSVMGGGDGSPDTPPPAPPPIDAIRTHSHDDDGASTAAPRSSPSAALPTVLDISTEEDRLERPFTVLLKLFHKSLTLPDQQAIRATLKGEEWNILWDCSNSQDQATIVASITRFVNAVGHERTSAFMVALTPRSRALFGEILVQCKRYAEKEPFAWSPCTMDASIVSVEMKREKVSCPKCSFPSAPDMRFCGRCGASMSSEPSATDGATADEPEVLTREISPKKRKKQRAAHA